MKQSEAAGVEGLTIGDEGEKFDFIRYGVEHLGMFRSFCPENSDRLDAGCEVTSSAMTPATSFEDKLRYVACRMSRSKYVTIFYMMRQGSPHRAQLLAQAFQDAGQAFQEAF